MYKVQNALRGTLSLTLEKGSISLVSGGFFDLERVCSRAWIKSDPIIRRLLAGKQLRLVHDSEEEVKSAPTHAAVKTLEQLAPLHKATPTVHAPKAVPPTKVEKPVVINLSLPEEPKAAPVPVTETLPVEQEDPIILDVPVVAISSDPVEVAEEQRPRKRGRKPKNRDISNTENETV